MRKMKNIDRYDGYFMVNLQLDHHLYSTRFNFDQYSGIKAAHLAAIDYRDRLRADLCLPESIEGVKTTRLPLQPLNPIIGVSRLSVLNINQRYTTTWSWTNKGRRQGYSTTKYGEELAFQLACEGRFEACGKLQVKGKLPFKPKVAYEFVKKKKYQ